MKNIFLLLLSCCLVKSGLAQVFITESCEVSFFSASAIENIEGVNKKSKALVNTKDKTVAIKLVITSFEFKSDFMKEHFNENYMESEKYPYASFSGKIKEDIDLSKAGTYTVNVSGKMNIHGVDKDVTIPATLVIKDAQHITASTKFKIKPADYKIKVPSLVSQNIAEELDVSFDASFIPYKK